MTSVHASKLEFRRGWVPVDDQHEMQDDFVMLGQGHDFNRAIDTLLVENKKC